MAVIQRLQQFKDIIPYIEIRQRRIQNLEISVIHMLKDKTGRLALWVSYNIQKLNDICPPTHILKNLNLTFNLLFLHGLEDFDDTFRVVAHVVAFKNLRIFATADFTYYFIVFLVTPVDSESFVIPVVAGTVDVDVCVDSDKGWD